MVKLDLDARSTAGLDRVSRHEFVACPQRGHVAVHAQLGHVAVGHAYVGDTNQRATVAILISIVTAPGMSGQRGEENASDSK